MYSRLSALQILLPNTEEVEFFKRARLCLSSARCLNETRCYTGPEKKGVMLGKKEEKSQ